MVLKDVLLVDHDLLVALILAFEQLRVFGFDLSSIRCLKLLVGDRVHTC